MLCPTCKTALAMAERHGIEIDYCPTCRGVWLDRGELDKILERAADHAEPRGAPAPQPAPFLPHAAPERGWRGEDRERDHHHRSYHGKKRKSFLSDIFDFD